MGVTEGVVMMSTIIFRIISVAASASSSAAAFGVPPLLRPPPTKKRAPFSVSASTTMTSASVSDVERGEGGGRSESTRPSASSVSIASAVAANDDDAAASEPFERFDYLSHWYPVSWIFDLIPNKPTRVTLFDTDYVISRIVVDDSGKQGRKKRKNDEEEVMALLDRCPHRSAALSEGRVLSCGRRFQCAYHGWSFDGSTGSCVEIPQTVTVDDVDNVDGDEGGIERVAPSPSSSARRRGRGVDATAVPAMVSQGMVWLFPGDPAQAYVRPPPPTVPEADDPSYRALHAVRDFPVDWTLLLENFVDPDHGLFSHQSSRFDPYVASKDAPLQIVEEETDGGRGWTVTCTVDAVPKQSLVDRVRRRGQVGTDGEGKAESREGGARLPPPRLATTVFKAPHSVVLARRDAESGEAQFVSAFFVCPTGTGHSRFLSTILVQRPEFVPDWLWFPRWLSHVRVNNFLDQDTYLLATQQKYVLEAEAAGYAQSSLSTSVAAKVSAVGDGPAKMANRKGTRRSLYAYRSPSEGVLVRIGTFLDATLRRVPNRERALRSMGAADLSLRPVPPREFVLDRRRQNVDVCPDSAAVVRRCRSTIRLARWIGGLAVVGKALAALVVHGDAMAPSSGGMPMTLVTRLNTALGPKILAPTLLVSAAVAWLASRIRKEFGFKYTESKRDRDLANIPAVWLDPP